MAAIQAHYINGIYSEEDERVEEAMLKFLRSVKQPVLPHDMIRELTKQLEVTQNVVREAIWRLVDRGEIKLTTGLKIELTK